MPSIILQDLSCVTPDGDTLFAGLDLTFGPVRTGLVGRNGVGKSSLLKLVTGALQPASGTVTVDGTIGLLAQDFGSDPDLTLADIFAIAEPLASLARVLDGTGSLEDAAEADWTLESRFSAALARVGLPDMAPAHRLDSLSGGQRTRIALAALLFGEPDFILLDEPTNNLDAEGRAAIADILHAWRGGAIVVSHDRQLLREMDAIVELTTLGARAYGGNWDHFAERKAIERAAAEQALAGAERRIGQIERKVQAVREKKARSDAAGRRKRAKGDAPKILLDARRDTAERTGGAQSRLADRLRHEADTAAETARAAVEILDDVALRLSPTGLPAGRIVLEVVRLTGGPDPQNPVIRDISLRITGPERVALTGPNGSGKTSLLRLVTGALTPVSGTVRIVAAHAMLDQHVSLLDPALSIRDNFRLRNPDDDENACRAALARFLFRADAALQPVGTLSGGERLRAGLAVTLGGGRPPDLLILDEPTNHLDLDAITAVETGLRAYDGALLVVSHDPDFLENIAITRHFRLAP